MGELAWPLVFLLATLATWDSHRRRLAARKLDDRQWVISSLIELDHRLGARIEALEAHPIQGVESRLTKVETDISNLNFHQLGRRS